MLFVRIRRKKISHDYKRNKNINDWHNNDKNNCLDDFELYSYETLIFKTKCQSVANIPTGRYLDTIKEGPFQIKCFLDKRNFWCDVHGICNTFDLENEWIDENSVEKTDNTRWLIHDDQKLKPNPAGQITRVCWSAGCIVLHKSDLEAFNNIIKEYGVKSNDIIHAELVEE